MEPLASSLTSLGVGSLIFMSALIVFLLFLSAFFSGSETALTAASRPRMHKLEQDGDNRAKRVNLLISNREKLIGAILLGNNLVNILASALATVVLLQLFGQAGVAYATLIMTALILVFSEVLPKTLAIARTEWMAMGVAPFIRIFVIIFGPVVASITWVVARTLRAFGVDTSTDVPILSAHEELRGAIDLHHQEGAVVKDDRDMLGGILDLRDLDVQEVMVHRKNMRLIDANQSTSEIVKQVLDSPHTRLPLWRDEPDNIIGVLHAKDLLNDIFRVGGEFEKVDIMKVVTEPWFVPETTGVQEQLDEFLRRRNHFALVVDEYGALMGLVTLEDILEEIVGEIQDEHDVSHTGIRPQPNGTINVDGSVPIRDLNRVFDWNLPDDEATTIAGLIIHEAKTIPEQSQVFNFYNFKFEILRKHRNQIAALRLTPPEKEEGANGESELQPM